MILDLNVQLNYRQFTGKFMGHVVPIVSSTSYFSDSVVVAIAVVGMSSLD